MSENVNVNERYSPNGFNIHREEEDNKNEEVNFSFYGTMFENKNDYYPDYEKYKHQGNGDPSKWDLTNSNVIEDDTINPETFFNSQNYLLNIIEKIKKQ